jgi:hypothetical protein
MTACGRQRQIADSADSRHWPGEIARRKSGPRRDLALALSATSGYCRPAACRLVERICTPSWLCSDDFDTDEGRVI